MSKKVIEALMGEGQASCDRCGRVTSADRVISIFTSNVGTKVDLCGRCSSKR